MPDLLPPNATPQERALSLTTGRAVDVPIKTLWSPHTCPTGVLPWLAWALSVDEWDATWPEQTQRNVIAASIEQHRRKGTIGALRAALQRLGYDVEIDEQTGAAYTFTLRMRLGSGESAGGAVAEDARAKVIRTALATKNVRSELNETTYLGQGGDAVLYSGGVPIIGAEVEIGSGVLTPLPLDGMDDFLVASFWTVRMNSSYTGPIAKVQRGSDSAVLDYYSLSELREFVDGESNWGYLGFFNQATPFRYASLASGTSGVFAELDSNQVPRQRTDNFTNFNYRCSFATVDVTAFSLISAGRANVTDAFQRFFAGFGLGINTDVQVSTENTATACLTASRSTSDETTKTIGARASAGSCRVYEGGASTSASASIAFKAENFTFGADDTWSDTPLASIYGGAFWAKDIGDSTMSALLTAIENKLLF
jgi:phage tail P2-like protein